jgi:hypothetical protein
MAGDDFSSTERRIREALTDAILELDGASDLSREWTAPLKRALCDLGQREGHLVWGLASDGWLFDLVWARSATGDQSGLIGLALAVEIEWNDTKKELLRDFLKLTVTNAELCLFIFDTPSTPAAIERKFALLKDACRVRRGNRYLVCGIESKHSSPFRVEFRSWTC